MARPLRSKLTGTNFSRWSRCKKGPIITVAELPKVPSWDSS